MAGKLLWGWDATNKVWVPLSVDANGYVKVDMSNISLNDLADVSVAAPADDDLFYYDNATSLWKSRKLVDADIPAAIARDAEVVAAIADHADDTTGVHGAGANTLWHGGLTNIIDKTHLSQDFGASATRLRNVIATPISGRILRIGHTEGSCFNALIDDNAGAHGGQGLDATHVPYDGETREDMFNGLSTYNGSSYWAQIVLHNTTRGNSRKIVSVDRTNNVIVTSSSTDDWADNDVITTESLTNVGLGDVEYFDMDLSDKIGTGVEAIFMVMLLTNNTANYSVYNAMFIHPYVAFDIAKYVWVSADLANEDSTVVTLLKVIDQKITVAIRHDGTDDLYASLYVIATVEYADT